MRWMIRTRSHQSRNDNATVTMITSAFVESHAPIWSLIESTFVAASKGCMAGSLGQDSRRPVQRAVKASISALSSTDFETERAP